MRLMSAAMTAIVTAATLGATVTIASAQSCQDLWIERNTYYKEAGYCFKTPRAISYFGNGGCYINNEAAVPLSRAVRARINQIIRLERAYGCPL
jgi:hypothetical protein